MIKVDSIPDITSSIPEVKEIWAVTRRELAQKQKSIKTLCNEQFGTEPLFILEDMSLRVYYFGIN